MKGRTVVVGSLVVALLAVFFLAPIIPLPTYGGCTIANIHVHSCTPAASYSVDLVVSPSSLLLGFGEVDYGAGYGMNCTSNAVGSGVCAPYHSEGLLFSWNCFDYIQYLH